MIDLPSFDEIHVVSDLHMGGVAGLQAFREGARLANFIRRLAALRPESRSALVLNGDVFDTLAEDIPGYIASDDAVDVVGRILRDPSFAPVWQALSVFVRCAGRTLVLVIGNHDLELALPAVQRLLLATLAGDDFAARGRIEFSTVGAGFACRVGACRIFCTHGNEVDGWNYNRYEDLAALARRTSAGRPNGPRDWHPNAGSRMVKEVMNGIKRRFAWIDLLKPETSAAIGALLVLDPAQMTRLIDIAGLVQAQRRGTREARQRLLTSDHPGADGMLEAPGSSSEPPADESPFDPATPHRPCPAPPRLDLRLLGPNLRSCLTAADATAALDDDLLAIAEHHLAEPPPLPAATAPNPAGLLGLPQLGRDWWHGVAPAEALRHALLDWLDEDKSFDPDAADDTSRRICASVDPAVDFIIAGHTHLERAIDRGDGRAYFNTGTWMRLLRLSPAMLASRESFAPVWQVLADGSMAAIDAARTESGPFVLDRASAVAIRREAAGDGPGGERVVAELLHVEGDGRGEPRPVRRFVRGAAA